MMRVLCEHTECYDAKTNDQHDESYAYGLPISSTDPWWISTIVYHCHSVQMLQVVEHVLHTRIALLRITPDGTHHDSH